MRAIIVGMAAAQIGAPAVVSGQTATQDVAPAAFTIDAKVALWTVAIKADKTQDFETVMAKLQQALRQSDKPERQQQAAAWKLLKIDKPLPDGNIVYVHVLNPVVRGADYTILRILYDAFPDERQALYELYRGSFVQSLSLASGSIVVDTGQTQ
jgi:hypothetical protein